MSQAIRILVVDDDLIDRLAIRRAIEQSDLDAEVDEAGTASEALDKAAGKLDCWLLDHELPGMSGTELTRQLRDSGDLTPVILVTGKHDEDLLQAAVDAGITDFFPKADLSPRRIAIRIRFAAPLSYHTFKMLVYGNEGVDMKSNEQPDYENDQYWR